MGSWKVLENPGFFVSKRVGTLLRGYLWLSVLEVGWCVGRYGIAVFLWPPDK